MTTLKNKGDALEAEKIAVRARTIKKVKVVAGTSTHNIQRTTLEGTAFCVILKPMRAVRNTSK